MIKSPYNFVPLSEKVVMPFWGNYISHDVPFKGSKSGVLSLKIKAESPIYVRNGMPRNHDENDPAKNDFNNVQGNCFIPGSSIKGMLRSVMEIMSFGRMHNKVNDNKYSVRDFQNDKIYPKTVLSREVECGWLYKEGGMYYIDKCGKPGRISHENLDALCGGQKISDFYQNSSNVKNDADKSAKSKNRLFPFGETKHRFEFDFEDNGRKVYKLDLDGKEGTIVMTGQSSVRKYSEGRKPSGKHLEFIFWETAATKTPVPEEVIENFFFAYYNHDKTQQKDDWKWRYPELEKGKRIPVFYRIENGEFLDLGLTMLYKITYKHSILDIINNQQKSASSYDLAEAIFGYVEDKKALKGRIHIGHAFVSNGSPVPLKEQNVVLAGPKASYYPNYIEQNPNDNGRVNQYSTYMDGGAKIRGWKRYPVRSGSDTAKNAGTQNVASKFIPLPKNTEFTFDIAYHNLRDEELGALISAITFHNTDGLYHAIGSAKPLGYGKIKVSIEKGLSKGEQVDALKAYEAFMDYALGNARPLWSESLQIKELFAMAKPAKDDSKLAYMELAEFASKKKDRFELQSYSAMIENNVHVNSLTSKEELEAAIRQYENEKDVYAKMQSVEDLKKQSLISAKAALKSRLDALKEELLSEIEKMKRDTLEKEREERNQADEQKREEAALEKQKTAKEEGFKLPEGFDTTNRNAFSEFSAEVLVYVEALHRSNEKQLKKTMPNGLWTQEGDFQLIKNTVVEIYKNLPNQSERKKWNKKPLKGNHAFNKVRYWLGVEEAKEFFENLIKE